MSSLAKTTLLCHLRTPTSHDHHRSKQSIRATEASSSSHSHPDHSTSRRKLLVTTLFPATSVALGVEALSTAPVALAQNWGTRSFIRERFFEPGLSPEDAVQRIRQTAEGLHSMRPMLNSMSWRYVMYYIRLKQAYLSQDLKSAFAVLPENRRNAYVKTANQLVENMLEFDGYVRTPKVYESYLYYEKTLKSLDDLVALLA